MDPTRCLGQLDVNAANHPAGGRSRAAAAATAATAAFTFLLLLFKLIQFIILCLTAVGGVIIAAWKEGGNLCAGQGVLT